jgi:hypothetical protein
MVLPEGLTQKYGVRRVIDTPITESAIVGAAGGAALTGIASGSGAHVCRLSWRLPRPNPESNCEVSLHVWRSG